MAGQMFSPFSSDDTKYSCRREASAKDMPMEIVCGAPEVFTTGRHATPLATKTAQWEITSWHSNNRSGLGETKYLPSATGEVSRTSIYKWKKAQGGLCWRNINGVSWHQVARECLEGQVRFDLWHNLSMQNVQIKSPCQG